MAHPSSGTGELDIRFAEFPQAGIEQDYTYHVDRSRFDQLLLEHARSLGSNVYQGTEVSEVLWDGDRAVGVKVKIEGQDVEVPARVVVDASGRNTVIGQRLGLRTRDPIFNQYAVHTWFENWNRGQGDTEDFIHIYFLPVKRGWVWQIPITETVTSVGVVADRSVFKQASQGKEEYFHSMLQTRPILASALEGATRVTDLSTEADYSYSMDRFVGDGWALVGDSARFVDPIFSSGVSIACYSAKYAAEEIIGGLEEGDVCAARLRPYEAKLKSGVTVWYEFIRLYYKLMNLFTYFVAKDEYRHQILQLLQGEVFDRESVPVLDEMRRMIEKVESSPNHLWKDQLGDVPI